MRKTVEGIRKIPPKVIGNAPEDYVKIHGQPPEGHMIIPKVQDNEMIDPNDPKERAFYDRINTLTMTTGHFLNSVKANQELWIKAGDLDPDRKWLRRVYEGPLYDITKIRKDGTLGINKHPVIKMLFQKDRFATLKDALKKGIAYFGNENNWGKEIGGQRIPLKAPTQSYEFYRDFCIVKYDFLKQFPDNSYWIHFDEIDLRVYQEILDTLANQIYEKKDYNAYYDEHPEQDRTYNPYIHHHEEYGQFFYAQVKRERDCLDIEDDMNEALEYIAGIIAKEKKIALDALDKLFDMVMHPNAQ